VSLSTCRLVSRLELLCCAFWLWCFGRAVRWTCCSVDVLLGGRAFRWACFSVGVLFGGRAARWTCCSVGVLLGGRAARRTCCSAGVLLSDWWDVTQIYFERVPVLAGICSVLWSDIVPWYTHTTVKCESMPKTMGCEEAFFAWHHGQIHASETIRVEWSPKPLSTTRRTAHRLRP
jgi:hypothetical protein